MVNIAKIIDYSVMLATEKQEIAIASVLLFRLGRVPPRAVLPASMNVAYLSVTNLYACIAIQFNVKLTATRECTTLAASVKPVYR